MFRAPAWLILSLLFGLLKIGHSQTRTEQLFKDPITGKSGQYTVKFPGPSAGAKSYGLLAYFHGSGNTAGYAGEFERLANVAQDFKLVPLAIQAPNQAITWPDNAHGPSHQHAAYVKSLLDRAVFQLHPEIDPMRTVFVGFSAGSTFLSGDFLPRYISEYKGGVILLCGGGGPLARSAEAFAPLKTEVAQSFGFYAYIQKADFLYGQTNEGLGYWRGRGAQVQSESPDGGGHCAFDFSKQLRRGLQILLK